MDVIDILVLEKSILRKQEKPTTDLDKTTDIMTGKTIDSNFISEKSLPDLCVTTTSLQQSSQETKKEFKRSKLIAVILTMMLSYIYYGLVVMGSFLVAFAVESNLKLRLNLDLFEAYPDSESESLAALELESHALLCPFN